jgi:hypothetical protein
VSAALSHYQNPTPSGGIWHSLNRLLIGLILLALALLTAYRFTPEISKRRVQMAILEELKVEVEKERQQLARNQREEEMLKHNPDYLGIIARDRLDLMKEGEKIYRIEITPGKKMRLVR